MKRTILIAATLITAGSVAFAQKAWPNYARYEKANREITEAMEAGAPRPLAVLMGDSITDKWPGSDPEFFKEYNLVGRGISGQCTSHMLARFQRDVVELKPKYVVILAGINDIAHNEGYSDVEDAYRNIISMCQIARQNGIKVILASTTPADHFPWRPEISEVNSQARWLNDSLREYAKANRMGFADYAAALSDGNGVTDREYSYDSVHPNAKGYKVMEEVLLKALKIRR